MTQLKNEELAADLLVDPDVYMPHLQSVVQRVGWNDSADLFMDAVRCTYQTVKAIEHRVDTLANFRRRKHLHVQFREALQTAASTLGPSLSILVIGCGTGFVGNNHQFAFDGVKEALTPEQISRIECHDLSSRDLRDQIKLGNEQGEYDLLVTHSFLHFLPNPAAFFAAVLPYMRPTAGYVMGHESNAKFWENPECVRVYEEYCQSNRSERMRRRPARLVRLLRRFSRGSFRARNNLFDDINRALRRRVNLTDNLSVREIRRIVDIHRHCSSAGDFTIGWDGFDLEELQSRYLPEWEVKWQSSNDFIGHEDPAKLSPRWRDAEQRLRNQFPHDGGSFSAFLLRTTTA